MIHIFGTNIMVFFKSSLKISELYINCLGTDTKKERRTYPFSLSQVYFPLPIPKKCNMIHVFGIERGGSLWVLSENALLTYI